MLLSGQALFLLVTLSCSSATTNSVDRCLRFGGGSCCPLLNNLDRPLKDVVLNQPEYIVFFPENEVSCTVDNICLTFFPLPDNSQTYLVYSSQVFKDGSNEINTFIVSEPEVGVRRLGSGLCQFTDTTFAEADCKTGPVALNHRCATSGDCPDIDAVTNSNSNVYGLSNVRQPISRACLSRAKAAITVNGLPEDDYYILPMRLPSRCVLNQVCTAAPALQRFCQTVGVAFPSVNRCVSSI